MPGSHGKGAAAHDAERDHKFRTIKQRIGDMRTRLRKALACVESKF